MIFCTTCACHARTTFRDITAEAGLHEPLVGLKGHGAARGDLADRSDGKYSPAREPLPMQCLPDPERLSFYSGTADVKNEKDPQFPACDLKTKKRKVIAFLHPFCEKKTGHIPMGAYSVAVSTVGDMVHTTWNGNRKVPESRGGRVRFNTCALNVIHIPESERPD